MAWSPLHNQPASSTTLAHKPSGGSAHSGLVHPTSSINHKNTLAELPAGPPDEGVFSVEILSVQMILACVKLTKGQQHTDWLISFSTISFKTKLAVLVILNESGVALEEERERIGSAG